MTNMVDQGYLDGIENHHHTKNDGSWWEYDAAGIPLTRVCEKCRVHKLARYNPAIFTDGGYAATGSEDALEAADYDEDGDSEEFDPENIYGLPSIRQSIEEDRK